MKRVDGVPIVHRGLRFPYYEDGTLVTIKHVLPKEWAVDGERKFKSFKEGKPVPFGLDRVHTNDVLVLVEGEIDALSVYEAGHSVVWSVPSGAKGLNWLEFESVVEALQKASTIVIAVDKDADGKELEDELIRRFGQGPVGLEKIQVAQFPPDCKDANDVLVQHGPTELLACIENAIPVPLDGISEADEFLTEFLDFYQNGLPKGFSTGIPTLDTIYRVMPGMVTVVTGIPSHGKSEFLDEIVRLMVENLDWKFAFYTPENTPTSLHMIKLAEKHVGKPFDQAQYGAMTEDEVMEAAAWMKENIFYVNPQTKTFSVDEILDRARVLVYRKGIQGLIIDPWNYVRKDFGSLREDQFINQELQKIGMFAKASGVHIWLVVHPRTLRKNKDDKIAVPNMYDLSGGSKFGDNADFILAVERDAKKAFETGIHEVTIHNQKTRYRPAGVQGHVKLLWEPFNGRFGVTGDAVIRPPDDDDMEIQGDGF
jgi:twinkle protein